MGWIDGWPHDPTPPKGSLSPQAVVLHRTYGGYGGDYSVGKQGIFQFLIGQQVGQYVQFMSTESVAYHCNGANFRAFGVELTGTNEDALTDWQVEKLGEILHYAAGLGIPLTYQDPLTTAPASISVNHSGFVGVISHISVMTDDGTAQHTDLTTPADYARAVGNTPAPTPPVPQEDIDMYIVSNPAAKADKYVVGEAGKRHIKSVEEYDWLKGPKPLGGGVQVIDTITQNWFDSIKEIV